MKRKSQLLVARLTEERILQLSNDLSEDIPSGTVEEWRAVALYFRNQVDRQAQASAALHVSLAALLAAEKMRAFAMKEIESWAEKRANLEKP